MDINQSSTEILQDLHKKLQFEEQRFAEYLNEQLRITMQNSRKSFELSNFSETFKKYLS